MADLDSERQDQAKNYTRIMRRISFLELGLTAFIALVLLITPQGFTTMMTKLANQNLSEAQPSRWVELLFYDHPPYFRRVARAQRYEEGAR